jgi:hypothetical protein
MDANDLQFIVTAIDQLDKKTQKKLDEILVEQKKTLVQTTTTNGRVNTLEDSCKKIESDQLTQWTILNQLTSFKDQMKGRDKAVWVFIGAICVVLWYVAQQALTIKIK